jgi:Ca-activated chloride channel family protein
MISEFQFEHPYALALLSLVPLYALFLWRNPLAASLRFPNLEPAQAARRITKASPSGVLNLIRILVISLAIIALANPRFVYHHTEKKTSGIDIMLVLDISWSMNALDMGAPGDKMTRIKIAQTVLRDFIQRRPDDRLGLVAFSAVPYLVCPLTLNHDWLIDGIDHLHVGLIRELGTAIGDATATAVKHLANIPQSKSRIIILLTDGDNNKGDIDPVPSAQLAASLGAKLYTIGVGKEEACSLPAFDPKNGQIIYDALGNTIPTITLQPANYDVLIRMSQLARGKSYRATNRKELEGIYNEINRLEKSDVIMGKYTTYTPLFQWPLLGALVLLILELLLSNTRWRRVP